MNDLYKSAAHALIKNLWLIIVVTALAGALAVGKELLFPASYSADTMLLVTGVEERGDTTKMMPPPLSPKAYETLLMSSSVLGKVLDRLKTGGAFGDATPPELQDFRANLTVLVDVVDETSRPVNYSPLIRLTALGKTEELATKIVDTWAEVATAQAQRAAAVRVGAPAYMLGQEKVEFKSELETAWEEMRKETSVWDLNVLKSDLDARVMLMNTFMEKRTGIERQFEVAKAKLELVRGDITTMLRGSQEKFTGESVDLREKLKAEMALANVDLISEEMNKQLVRQVRLAEDQGLVERQLRGFEESLVTIRKSLETEKPMLQLGHAPSDTAYWIVGGANTKSLSDLKEKVMVSQEMNPVYLELKKNENAALAAISQKKAEFESMNAQAAALSSQIAALNEKYGPHKMNLARLTNDLAVAEKVYGVLGEEEEMSVFTLERSTLLEVKGAEVELEAIDRQVEALRLEKEALQLQLAEHTMIQTRLKTQTGIAEKIFSDVASAESFMSAAHAVAQGEKGKDNPVGLNRITTETYATEDKGLLGRKGRVLLTTALALLLTCAFAYIKDDGAPRVRRWLVELG
jgi:uncharacterized protein involved in exopolysaccharide biosynthesis